MHVLAAGIQILGSETPYEPFKAQLQQKAWYWYIVPNAMKKAGTSGL